MIFVDLGGIITPQNVKWALMACPAHSEVDSPEGHQEGEDGGKGRVIEGVESLIADEDNDCEDPRPH